MNSIKRGILAISGLIVSGSAIAGPCPAGAVCYFGTDVTGSASTRATNVNSAITSASFLSTLSGVGTETFESFAGGTVSPIALTFLGAGTATLGAGGTIRNQGAGTNGAGRYPTSGTRFYEAVSASGGGTTFTIDFSAPVAAFGFYGIDIGEFGSQLSLQFTLTAGGTQTWELPYVATNGTNTLRDGSILYAGFINTATFTSVSFLGTSSDDFFAFDDMTIASVGQVTNPVPEPETYALFGAGLAALAFVRRRSRKTAA